MQPPQIDDRSDILSVASSDMLEPTSTYGSRRSRSSAPRARASSRSTTRRSQSTTPYPTPARNQRQLLEDQLQQEVEELEYQARIQELEKRKQAALAKMSIN
jgi:hypothetical protein